MALGRVLVAVAAVAAAVLTALTFGSASAQAAFPFPTNGKIACGGVRGADADLEIFDVNPDGSGERLLTNNGFRDSSPSYSPDGKKIAFESGRDRIPGQGDNTEIYVGNNDGNLTGPDVRRLTFNRGVLPNGTLSALAATDFSPTWSPDGTEIAFHSGRVTTFDDGGTTPTNDFEIYKMSATTGDTPATPATRLTENRGQDAIPSWSPDGTKIAFQGFPPGNPPTLNNNLEIWTINPDGTDRTNVSNNPGTPNNLATPVNENLNGLDRDVIWSSDSQQLAFNSARASITGNQNNDVWKMNRNGSSPVRLTTGPDSPFPAAFTDYDAPLVWSPDNSTLLIGSSRSSTIESTNFIAYKMDPNLGDAGPVVPVVRYEQFARCDWTRPLAAPPVRPNYPPPPSNPQPSSNCPAGTSAGVSCQVLPGGGRRITGGAGNDTINGTAGNDVINCGPGDDVVNAGGGDDVINCGAGNDRVNGGAGNDRIDGGSGNDRLSGNEGNDRVVGGSGNDRANGNEGRDRVGGQSGNDRVGGQSGNDRVNGERGRDRVSGGSGNDRVGGQSGNDRVNGDSGRDRVNGGSGRDRISGASGNDSISARDRTRDRVSCGRGRDRLSADRIDRVARGCERVRRR